jgi:hypothetical protein
MSEWHHSSMEMQGWRSKRFDGSGRAKARNPNAGDDGAEEMRLRLSILKMGGEASIYRER